MTRRQAHPFLLLTFLSAIALAGILLFTVREDRLRLQKKHPTPLASGELRGAVAEIAVEHDAAATLTIRQSSGKNEGIVEFAGEGADLRLSVPSSWERRDVRGAALSDVPSDPPAMGYTRWHLPEGVTLSFHVAGSPVLSIRNPSPTPLLIIRRKVDIVRGKVEEKSVLIKEGAVRL